MKLYIKQLRDGILQMYAILDHLNNLQIKKKIIVVADDYRDITYLNASKKRNQKILQNCLLIDVDNMQQCFNNIATTYSKYSTTDLLRRILTQLNTLSNIVNLNHRKEIYDIVRELIKVAEKYCILNQLEITQWLNKIINGIIENIKNKIEFSINEINIYCDANKKEIIRMDDSSLGIMGNGDIVPLQNIVGLCKIKKVEQYEFLFSKIGNKFLTTNFELKLNKVLDKINNGKKISTKEKNFLLIYPRIIEIQNKMRGK